MRPFFVYYYKLPVCAKTVIMIVKCAHVLLNDLLMVYTCLFCKI